MYTAWFLNNLDSEYDSFQMMLTNNQKANQAKDTKKAPDFDSILEQVLSLDTQKKTSKSRSIKSAVKRHMSKKSASVINSPCFYCNKDDHTKDKWYYKHLNRASQSFRDRLKDRIADLQSRHSMAI